MAKKDVSNDIADTDIEASIESFLIKAARRYKWSDDEIKATSVRMRKVFDEWETRKEFNFTMFKKKDYNQLVILKNIEFDSTCEHHMLPFRGHAHVAYLPNDKICGVSKLARAVVAMAAKPQTQEYLTKEIIEFLTEKLDPRFVMLVMEAQHECMTNRGIKQKDAVMVTSELWPSSGRVKGSTLDDDSINSLKQEALQLFSWRRT